MARVFNDQPRPRALLEDLSDREVAELRKLFPSVREVEGDEELFEQEADVLVTRSHSVSRAGHIHVVSFGSIWLGSFESGESEPTRSFRIHTDASHATELTVPDAVTGELGALVQSRLVPLFSAMAVKPVLVVPRKNFPRLRGDEILSWCTPFLIAGDGSVLAGSFRRRGGGTCWVLPGQCDDIGTWVAVALKEFREVDPERIPALPAWWESPEWATPQQRAARAAVTELDAERVQAMKDFDERLIRAKEAVSLADEAAAEGASRLLRADGDQLVDAVQDCLVAFGFEVDDMDEHFPKGDRREDLRVRDPNRPGWEAIVEVKGYVRGAQVNDLARLARWSARYAAENKGRLPDAQWHVVNAFRGVDPSARPKAIPNDDDLSGLIADGGLLIDTRALFSAWRAMANGEARADKIRENLVTTGGRWELPSRADSK